VPAFGQNTTSSSTTGGSTTGAPVPSTTTPTCDPAFQTFVQNIGNNPAPNCINGEWQLTPTTGTFDIGTQSWDIASNHIRIFGNVLSQPSPVYYHFNIDPLNPGDSGQLIATGTVNLTGIVKFTLLNAPADPTDGISPVTSNVVFMSFPPGRLIGEPFSGSSQSEPNLVPPYNFCRSLNSAQVTAAANNITLTIVTAGKAGASCASGRTDRLWVLALIILLCIHGVALVLFALITCKNESMKAKVWDLKN